MSALTRQEISAAVTPLGWRYVLGEVCARVPVRSLGHAAEVAAALSVGAGESLRLELRHDVVAVSLSPVTPAELALAGRLAARVEELGLRLGPAQVQVLEIAIDAVDIPRIRPFWKAVLGYVAEPGDEGPAGALMDPLRRSPAVWFQQMSQPRTQRNRIHLDVSVAHDAAQARIDAALAAGGTLRSAEAAPAFWVLADPEGNEACVTTWQGRD
ncbi:VOC family protein [Amycolatopsis sp.]|uniref:VOC family protein n=1 Tax=Amycolatopsis sp. TaxID=37632 RepID=UPI002BD4371C|nr:VOC family protein [Amycolatopsis sp.]HVV14758.1 VOC family protein [Amycolatopsis sp.]